MTLAQILALGAGIAALLGCGTDSPVMSEPFTITPEGGTIEPFDGAIRLDIPAGAVDTSIRITVSAVAPSPMVATVLRKSAVRISPGDFEFNLPVAVRLSYTETMIPSGSGVAEGELGIYRSSLGSWSLISNEVDAGLNSLTGTITRLGTYAVLGAPIASVQLSVDAASVPIGESLALTADARSGAGLALPGRPVTWESTAAGVASVSDDGLVHALSLGSTRIIANAEGLADTTDITTIPSTPPGPFNEPAGYVTIVERPFNSKASEDQDRGTGSFPSKVGGSEGFDGIEYQASALTIQQDPTAPFSPPNVMRAAYPAQTVPDGSTYSPGTFQTQGFGGAAHGNLALTHIYFRTAIKVSANWQAHPNGSSPKLVFFRTSGSPRVDNVLNLLDDGAAFVVGWNLQGSTRDGREQLVQNVGEATQDRIAVDAWNVIEVRAVLNSVGVKNGILQIWLNGNLVLDYADIEFLPTATTQLYWDTGHFNSNWGGQGGTIESDMFLFWDHAYFSGRP